MSEDLVGHVDRRLREVLGEHVLRARPPARAEAAAALTEAHATAYGFAPEYVVFAESPLAGAHAVGLVQLFHNDASGLARAPVDARTADRAPAGVADDVRRQVDAQRSHGRRALPLDRAVAPEAALWGSLFARVEEHLGLSAAHQAYGATYHPRYSAWDNAVVEQLDEHLPADWFYHRDLNSVNSLCDALFLQAMSESGVPGLEAWGPFIAATRFVDHYWMRSGYIVISDPPAMVELEVEAGVRGAAAVTVRWPDGWTVTVRE